VGPETFRSLADANPSPAEELVVAEALAGDRYVLAPDDEGAERVWQLRADTDERWLAGSSFARWLDAVLAAEPVLYDSDGEFLLAAFEEDGEELAPPFALRRAERALRKDPGSALYQHELGVAQRRLGRPERAYDTFAQAAALDPGNIWPWFDLGRCGLELGRHADAAAAFRRAAEAAPTPSERARFLAWAARAALDGGDRAAATEARDQALHHDPDIAAALARAAEAAASGDEPAARVEAEALASVFEPGVIERRRLPVLPASPPSPPRKPRKGGSSR
jgi:tetratricopeptide (TPR) repeat protein